MRICFNEVKNPQDAIKHFEEAANVILMEAKLPYKFVVDNEYDFQNNNELVAPKIVIIPL